MKRGHQETIDLYCYQCGCDLGYTATSTVQYCSDCKARVKAEKLREKKLRRDFNKTGCMYEIVQDPGEAPLMNGCPLSTGEVEIMLLLENFTYGTILLNTKSEKYYMVLKTVRDKPKKIQMLELLEEMR
ncbi:MAG TPA: hypothetical protein VMW53_07435 [archaeon]|nr:hypothetical protein [archaeon]